MTHDEAFLQAVIESPEDDAPRLVYADYLDDHGRPERASLIRVQCLLAKLPEDDPRREELEAQERALLWKHEEEWVGPLRGLASAWAFRRGFLEVVTLPARSYLEQAGFVRTLAPIRRFEVGLFDFDVAPAILAAIPEPVARENIVIPLGRREGKLVLAVRDPDDTDALGKLRPLLAPQIEPVAAPAEQIIEAINRHYNQGESEVVGFLLREWTDLAIDFTLAPSRANYKVGDRVRIVEGVFALMRGVIVSPAEAAERGRAEAPENSVWVLITIFGRQVLVPLQAHQLADE
jgi:uncharacterized protein (TIGR02996 family)